MKNLSEATSDERTPFERFEELAKKIIAVPKKELDEKLIAYKRKKRRRKKRKINTH